MDAYRHLAEWLASLRDAAHSVALRACSAALRGDIEAETARGLFAAFAEKHDLMAPETDVIRRLPTPARQSRGGVYMKSRLAKLRA